MNDDLIDEIHIFCIVDPKTGLEGIPAFLNQTSHPNPKVPQQAVWQPMVAINAGQLKSMKMIALDMEKKVGAPLKLFKFKGREEVLDWKPLSPVEKPKLLLKLP